MKCELCGKDMKLRQGPHGQFYGCTGYPDCGHTKKVEQTPVLTKSSNEAASRQNSIVAQCLTKCVCENQKPGELTHDMVFDIYKHFIERLQQNP